MFTRRLVSRYEHGEMPPFRKSYFLYFLLRQNELLDEQLVLVEHLLVEELFGALPKVGRRGVVNERIHLVHQLVHLALVLGGSAHDWIVLVARRAAFHGSSEQLLSRRARHALAHDVAARGQVVEKHFRSQHVPHIALFAVLVAVKRVLARSDFKQIALLRRHAVVRNVIETLLVSRVARQTARLAQGALAASTTLLFAVSANVVCSEEKVRCSKTKIRHLRRSRDSPLAMSQS